MTELYTVIFTLSLYSTLAKVLEVAMQALGTFREKLGNETDEGKRAMLTRILSEAEEAEKRLESAMHSTKSSPDEVKDAQEVGSLL